jgi:hypothetical protein
MTSAADVKGKRLPLSMAPCPLRRHLHRRRRKYQHRPLLRSLQHRRRRPKSKDQEQSPSFVHRHFLCITNNKKAPLGAFLILKRCSSYSNYQITPRPQAHKYICSFRLFGPGQITYWIGLYSLNRLTLVSSTCLRYRFHPPS